MMRTMIKLTLLGLSMSLCASVFSADSISKVTYKWSDDQGFTQYTERPPRNRAYEKITVNATGGEEITAVSAVEATSKAKETTTGALDEVVRANERNCKIAKQNMEVLVNMARIRVSDDKGENRILTPEEKQSRLDDTQKQIDIYCKDINAT